jgi:hypothetical protein
MPPKRQRLCASDKPPVPRLIATPTHNSGPRGARTPFSARAWYTCATKSTSSPKKLMSWHAKMRVPQQGLLHGSNVLIQQAQACCGDGGAENRPGMRGALQDLRLHLPRFPHIKPAGRIHHTIRHFPALLQVGFSFSQRKGVRTLRMDQTRTASPSLEHLWPAQHCPGQLRSPGMCRKGTGVFAITGVFAN